MIHKSQVDLGKLDLILPSLLGLVRTEQHEFPEPTLTNSEPHWLIQTMISVKWWCNIEDVTDWCTEIQTQIGKQPQKQKTPHQLKYWKVETTRIKNTKRQNNKVKTLDLHINLAAKGTSPHCRIGHAYIDQVYLVWQTEWRPAIGSRPTVFLFHFFLSVCLSVCLSVYLSQSLVLLRLTIALIKSFEVYSPWPHRMSPFVKNPFFFWECVSNNHLEAMSYFVRVQLFYFHIKKLLLNRSGRAIHFQLGIFHLDLV